MTEAIYRIAASVGTPLALAGVTVALFSRIALAVIKKLAAGRPEDTAPVLKRMLDLFFILSLVATILGGVAWFCAKYIDPPTPKTGALAPRNRGPVRSDSGCAMKFDTHSGVLHFYAP